MASSKKSSKNNSATTAQKFFTVSRWLLRAVVVLIPALFTTLTTDSLELTKFVAFSWLIVLGVVAALIGAMLDRTWSWQRIPLVWPLLGWNVAVSVATIFSLNQTISLWGDSGLWHHGLIATILFSVLYIWVVQLADRRLLKELCWWLVGSILAVGIFVLLQIRGIYLFPQEQLHTASFNPISVSLSLTAVAVALIVIISLGMLRAATERFSRVVILAAAGVAGIILIVMDRSLGWYVLIAGLLALLIFTARSRDSIRWGFWINGLLLLAVAGLLIPIPNSLVSDISLTRATSQHISTEVLRDHPIVGTGPGTFVYDFSMYRPTDFNRSLLWDSRFIKAGSDWWQLTATTGLLGLIAWLVLQALVIRYFWQRFAHEKQSPMAMGLASAWVVLLTITLLFPSNFVSWFLYWLVLAIAVSYLKEETRSRTGQNPYRTIGSFILAVVLIGGSLALLHITRLWLSDRSMAQAQAAIQNVDDLAIVEQHFADAVRYAPHDPVPLFALAQNKIVRIQVGLSNKTMTESDATDLLQEAIANGEAALALAPRRADSYESLIGIYGQINSITGQATGPSILKFQQQLITLEPNQPRHYTDLGLSYIARSEALRSQEDLDDAGKTQLAQDLDSAQDVFDKAVVLKEDYATGYLGQIRVAQLKGNKESALTQADAVAARFTEDASTLYTLGTIYAALEVPTKAEQSYQAALKLAPNDPTVLVALGQLAETQNDTDTAKGYYQQALTADPQNETAQSRLDALTQQ